MSTIHIFDSAGHKVTIDDSTDEQWRTVLRALSTGEIVAFALPQAPGDFSKIRHVVYASGGIVRGELHE